MADVCHRYGVKVGIVPGASDVFGPSVELDEVEGVTVLGVNPPVLGRTSRALKRGFDVLVATPTLLLSVPVILAAFRDPDRLAGSDLLPSATNRQTGRGVHAAQVADDGGRR